METLSHAADVSRCIWCAKATLCNEPPEHIVPEAIGCPEDFVLRNGEVCASCNHGLSHLDQALVGDLEVYALMAGVPRKRNRPPKVSSYGNFHAKVQDGHASYYFNMGSTPVETNSGNRLPGFRGGERDVRAAFDRSGSNATVTFELKFGRSPKVARALVKMASEYLCWAKGRDFAAAAITGAVADFVLHGKGYRPVILGSTDKTKYEHWFGLIGNEEDGLFCCFRLAHFEVMVDFSYSLAPFKVVAQRLFQTYGTEGWSTLPVNAVSSSSDGLVFRQ